MCRRQMNKGELRLETCAFVMPGRRTVLMTHAMCVTGAQVRDMLCVYKSVGRVPVGGQIDRVVLDEAYARVDRMRHELQLNV